jgi:hypothetical protein
MNQNVNHIPKPVWLSLARGTLLELQHRHLSSFSYGTPGDDPLDEILAPPPPAPPMVDLAEEWSAQNGSDGTAFRVKRPEQIGTVLQLLTRLRLAATFRSHEGADALCKPAAITELHVGHQDWILPVTLALKDLVPEVTIATNSDAKGGKDLILLTPFGDDNLGVPKDAKKVAKSLREAFAQETPILLVTAGHRGLPEAILRLLPTPIRLAPIDANIITAMLHLRFADGDADQHASIHAQLPAADMLARLGLDALHAAFRCADGDAIIASLSEQAAGLIPKDGPTLADLDDTSEAVTAARQIMSDLQLWAEGRLRWSECVHSLLLHGKPGMGKTYLARAMSRSGLVPVIQGSLAQWQSAGHLGDLQAAMRATFAEAIAAAPCVLMIEEIDAAGSRDSGGNNGNYRRQVINCLLEQIDLAIAAEGVVLVGACNDVAALDAAIVRPGRFDRVVEVPLPGRAALTLIVQKYIGDDLSAADKAALVTTAIGATPAIVEAAIRRARSTARAANTPLQLSDITIRLTGGQSLDAALMWRIAIHECGHVILAVDRVLGDLTEVRVGRRDGRTTITPDIGCGLPRDHRDLLAYTLGGRAAELVIFGAIGSGSGGSERTCDLAYATQIAVQMETAFGYGLDGLVWSPGDIGARITDAALRTAVQKQLETAEWAARRVLEAHKVLLLEMSKDLLRNRILEGAALQIWIDRIVGDAPWNPEDPSGRRAAEEEAAIVDGGTVIHLRDHRLNAPS